MTGVGEERIFSQDLSPQLVRDWLDDACIDAIVDEDDDVFVELDGTRMCVRVDQPTGTTLMWCSILCDDDVDRGELLEAVNEINAEAMFIRAVLCDNGGERWVRYEHEHWGLEGVVGRRQLVRLVRHVKVQACAAHDLVLESVEG